MTPDGLMTRPSAWSQQETLARAADAIAAKGLTLMARIDHAAGAQAVGLSLRPTEVLIFGNPKSGTPLMQANQTVGIDLPLKILVWQDAEARVFLSYNDPAWLALRHGLGEEGAGTVKAMTAALAAIAEAATTRV